MGESLTKWLPLPYWTSPNKFELYYSWSWHTLRSVSHCIRLRPITPQYSVEDFSGFNPLVFQPDPITRNCSELAVFDHALPDLLTDTTFSPEVEPSNQPNVLLRYVPLRMALRLVAPSPPRAQVTPQSVAPILAAFDSDPLSPPDTFSDTESSPLSLTNVRFLTDDSAGRRLSEASFDSSNVLTVAAAHTPSTLIYTVATTPSCHSTSIFIYTPQIYPPSQWGSSSSTFSGFSESFVERARNRVSIPVLLPLLILRFCRILLFLWYLVKPLFTTGNFSCSPIFPHS